MTTTQHEQMLVELHGIEDQIRKGHHLNVHFRAFQLAHAAWQEHIRANAVAGARGGFVSGTSPPSAVLDDERSGTDESPTFNHTRGDGLYDPCPICLERMTRKQLVALVKDLRAYATENDE